MLLIWVRGCEGCTLRSHILPFLFHVCVCVIYQFENCRPLKVVFTRNSSMDWNSGCAPFFLRTSAFQALVIYLLTVSAEPFMPPFLQQRNNRGLARAEEIQTLIISAPFCSFASPPIFPWRSSTLQWEALFSSWSWRRQYAQSLSFSSFLFPPLTFCNVMNGDSLR